MRDLSRGAGHGALATRVFPARSLPLDAFLVLGGSAVVALFAQISIPLWFTPVPITGQTLAVLLVGASLGSRRGALALVLYLLEGGAGLPFFAAGTSGWPVVAGPTGGYLVGFILAAYAVGWLAERGWDRGFLRAAPAMLVGNLAIYILGLPWLAKFVGASDVFAKGLLPFIPGDLIKLALAAGLLPSVWVLLRTLGRPNGDGPGE